MLCRDVGTQTHGRQHFQPLNIAFSMLFRPVQYHPALTETGDTIGFRQTVKGNGQQIRRQCGDRMVLGFVIEDLVVDFIGEDDQVVLAGDLNNLQQQLFGIHCTGRVVRVNDDDPAGAWGDFCANIV